MKLLSIFMIALTLTLPVVDALSISNVIVTDITDKNAHVQWTTDVAADGTVRFDVASSAVLSEIAHSSDVVTQHDVVLRSLDAGQQYKLSVASAAGAEQAEDTNNGVFYTFTTAAQDTFQPSLVVSVPLIVNTARIDIRGSTEDDAEVRLTVNGQFIRRVIASQEAFEFTRVALATGQQNQIDITVSDVAGNTNSAHFTVLVDTRVPEIDVTLPAVVNTAALPIRARISEDALVTITIDNESVFSQRTREVVFDAALDDGEHSVVINATDDAGNSGIVRQIVSVDTTPPELDDVQPLESNAFFYEGRAIDTVKGKTEPGANVFLLVNIQQAGFSVPGGLSVTFGGGGSQLTSNQLKEVTEKAQFKTTADDEGNFHFSDVDFEHPGFAIGEVAPEEIPSGVLIDEERGSRDASEKTIQVVVVVVDKVGLSTHRQFPVNIGTCFSGFGVNIQVLPEYQSPSILSPQRLDSGTEIVSFVLNTEYRGSAQNNRLDPRAKEREDNYYEITDVSLQPLCRASPFLESHESYQFACQIIGRRPSIRRAINIEHTNWYFRYNLGASDKFTDFDEEFWKKVLKNELRFPFEIQVAFNEKVPGHAEQNKVVTLCRDVVYFVDAPIDPRKVLPDNLLKDAQKLANETITVLNDIIPTLERIIQYAGIGCLGSFGLRTIVQVYRRFTQKIEYAKCKSLGGLSSLLGKDNCPVQTEDQIDECFYLEEDGQPPYPDVGTVRDAKQCAEVADTTDSNGKRVNRGSNAKKVDFKESDLAQQYFPGTISAWEMEMQLYQAYRFLCDRVFCHSAPAKWTQEKSVASIQQAEFEARDCPAPSTRYLRPVENCYEELAEKQGVLDKLVITRPDLIEGDICYRMDNAIYRVTNQDQSRDGTQYAILERIDKRAIIATSNQFDPQPKQLVAIPYEGGFRTASTLSCQLSCAQGSGGKDKWDYVCADSKQGPLQLEPKTWFNRGTTMDCWGTDAGTKPSSSNPDLLSQASTLKYNNDCFCREKRTEAVEQQKQKTERAGAKYAGFDVAPTSSIPSTPSTTPADTPENEGAWPWNYREWRINKESDGKAGIYYPKERYYERRDFPAAFGQNYLLDYIKGEPYTTTAVSHRELIGTFQTVCLTGIRARLIMLRSLLIGFQRCLKEVETTGKADAGVCKEIFSQLVCNLAYKAFTLFQDQCVPGDFGLDLGDTDEAIETYFKAGSSAVTETADSVVDEVSEEYGNAQLDQFLDGGSEALMKKVCLAAFGIETGFDLDSILDAAYTTSLDTSVGLFSSEGGVGRREFLSFNPTTRQSIFEYRAAWLIMPGCSLQNYQIELAAITHREDAQFPNTECVAVNNNEPGSNGCDNYNGQQEERASFYGGKPVKQGIYVDQNKALNLESQFRYDHFKITLFGDKSACFPKQNTAGNAGVFYFPIHDATAKDLLQCQVQATGGKFICSFGDEQGVGQAWFDKVECFDEDTQSFKRCDRVVFSAESRDEIRVHANVFTSGKKMCLKAFVEPENALREPRDGLVWWDVIGTGEAGIVPLDMPLVPVITQELFRGRAGEGITLNTPIQGTECSLSPSPSDDADDSQKVGGAFGLFTFDKQSNGKFHVRVSNNVKISRKGGAQDVEVAGEFLQRINAGGRDFSSAELQSIRYVINGYGATNIFGDSPFVNTAQTRCQVKTFPLPSNAVDQQTWPLVLELYFPNDQDECNDEGTVPVILPTGVAFKTKEEIPLKILSTEVTNARQNAFDRARILYVEGTGKSRPDLLEQASIQFLESTRTAPKEGDLLEVEARWWVVVSLVQALRFKERQPGPDQNVIAALKQNIRGRIAEFESRKLEYTKNAVLISTDKYKLIDAYMTQIKNSGRLGP